MSLLPSSNTCCDPCENSTTTTTSLADLIDAATASRLGMVNVLDEGADSTGATDSTDALQVAIDSAFAADRTVFFPPGTYKHTGLIVYSGTRLIGSGSGRLNAGGNTILLYTGTGIAIQGNGAAVRSFSAQHLAFYGTDGNGGTGLLMDSFEYSLLFDVLIGKHRNAGNTGYGLRLINTYANCAFNRIVACTFEDCDTALEMDSINATYSCGYNTLVGTVIYQEVNCVLLKSTAANGSIYNVFDGLHIQGNSGAGTYLAIAGHGNSVKGVIIDQAGVGPVLTFNATNATDNYVHFIGGFDVTKYTNLQSTGAANVVDFGGQFTYSPGRQTVITESDSTVNHEFSLQAQGNRAVEVYFGNGGAGAQAWRIGMAASATPHFQMLKGSTTIQQWMDTFIKFLSGGTERMRLTNDGLRIQPVGVAADTTAALDVRGTAKFSDTVEITGEATLLANLLLQNANAVRSRDSGGTVEAVLSVSAGNNAQLLSPTSAGGIQLIGRHASATIDFRPAANTLCAQVDGSATANHTRLLVYDVDSGLMQRVKAGANGTGPGGTGRALYIDNV